MSVFISYRSKEFEEASWVKNCLEDNGIPCWMAPDSIKGGMDYAAEIDLAIKECDLLVLILSTSAQQSIQIPNELELAVIHSKSILPFQIERCDLVGGFEYRLANIQRYFAYLDWENEISKMIRRILEIFNVTREDLKIPKINQDYTFDLSRLRFFSQDGYEETVFKYVKDADGKNVHIDVDFEPTRIREKIPAFAGAYLLTPGPYDISRKALIRFKARSEDRSITILRVEIKPYKSQWMHESFEFEIGPELKTFEISVPGFTNPQTAKAMGEITFVLKTDAFSNQRLLKGKLELADLEVLSKEEQE